MVAAPSRYNSRPPSANRAAMIRLLPPAAVCVLLLLAGCGQTGPLYLPDQPPPRGGLSIQPDNRNPGEENRARSKPVVRPVPAPSAASSVPAPAADTRAPSVPPESKSP
jgi:predicted small lipoprotein YifL